MDNTADMAQGVTQTVAPHSVESLQGSAELVMKLDVGTLSGVIGVILTIVFFVLGYRQTIGAKKERASAANKNITETLLRRFTLEEGFSIRPDGLEKIIIAKAIEYRVHPSDLHSLQNIENIIYGKIIDSDHIDQDKRKAILEKIEHSFKQTKETDKISGATENPGFLSGSLAGLGFASAALAGGFSGAISFLLKDRAIEKLSIVDAANPIIAALALIVATTVALVTFARLREREKPTTPQPTSFIREGMLFERRFAEMISAKGFSANQCDKNCDFIVATKHGKLAIELKLNIGQIPSSRISHIINRLEQACTETNCVKGLLVSKIPVSSRVKRLETALVTIVDEIDALEIIQKIDCGDGLPKAAE